MKRFRYTCMVVAIILLCTAAFASGNKFRLGELTVEPNPVDPYQGQAATVTGLCSVSLIDSEPFTPLVTVRVAATRELPVSLVEVERQEYEQDGKQMSFVSWQFRAEWDGRTASGDFAYPGSSMEVQVQAQFDPVGMIVEQRALRVNVWQE